MAIYQIEVRAKQGNRLLAVVEHPAESEADAATLAAEEHQFRHPDDKDDEGLPVVVDSTDTDMAISTLDGTVLYTVEVERDGEQFIQEVEAESPEAAENIVTERFDGESVEVHATASRTVYPDSIIPVVNQAGPTPL